MSMGYRRRDVQRLALGAAGAAGLHLPAWMGETALAEQVAAPLPAVAPAEAFGLNEAFRAMGLGALSGAGWTRYTVQWFNVQPSPDELNRHYFYDHLGRSVLEGVASAGMKTAGVVIGTP